MILVLLLTDIICILYSLTTNNIFKLLLVVLLLSLQTRSVVNERNKCTTSISGLVFFLCSCSALVVQQVDHYLPCWEFSLYIKIWEANAGSSSLVWWLGTQLCFLLLEFQACCIVRSFKCTLASSHSALQIIIELQSVHNIAPYTFFSCEIKCHDWAFFYQLAVHLLCFRLLYNLCLLTWCT